MALRSLVIVVLTAIVHHGYSQVTSAFNVNAESWKMHNNAGGYIDSALYSATAGNPGGTISVPSAIAFVSEYYQAPAKYLINLNDSYNQKVTFDLFVNAAGTDVSNPDILFSGGGFIRFYYVFPSRPAANVWTSYSVTLSEADPNWHYGTLTGPAPTRVQWKQVLSNVQQFEIRARYATGSAGTYSSSLDNVKINKISFQTAPVITSIAPILGTPNTTVTITGTNFNPTASQDIVFFGGIKTPALTASTTQITVNVPTGAQLGRITVVDISTGLQAQSSANFSPQFNNNNDFGGRIIPASLNARVDLPLDAATYTNVIFQAGDIDGDGWIDIVIGEPAKNELSIYQNLQNGGTITTTGSFSAKQTFVTGYSSAYGSVFLSDLDGDGKLDVIMGVEVGGAAEIAILRNTSAPGAISFAPVQFIRATGYADGPLSVADIDGDGRPEILSTWANSAGAGVFYFSLMQNLSTPGNIDFAYFQDPTGGAINSQSNQISTGDLDNDGKIDVAFVTAFDGEFYVLRNSSTVGSFSFDAPVLLDAGGNPHNVVLADLDSDGRLDLAFNGYSTSNILVMKNNSSPGALTISSFATPVTLTSPVFANGGRIGIGDLNGDSRPDLILAGAQGMAVFENNGSPGIIDANTFLTGTAYPGNGTAPYGTPLTADFNNDGKLDIAMNQWGGPAPDNIAIFQNNCYPTPKITGFTPASAVAGSTVTLNGTLLKTGATAPPAIIRQGALLANGTLTSNTAASAVIPTGSKSDRWSVTAHGLTGWSPTYPVTFPTSGVIDATSLAAPVTFALTATVNNNVMLADFDDDGKIDVGVTDNSHTGKVFQNTQASAGQAIAASSLTQIATTFNCYDAMAAVDIDGDGKTDITSGYNIYRNKSTTGSIAFDAAVLHTTNFSVATFGDFNNDGKIDLATIGVSNNLGLYENRSAVGSFVNGGFASTMSITAVNFVRPTSVQFGAIVSTDLDGDGNIDIATANPAGNSWSYYKNMGVKGTIGATSFAAHVDMATGVSPYGIAASDFDRDGLVDIAIVNFGSVFVSVYHNTTTGGIISFAAPTTFAVATKGFDMMSQDMDGDGRDELIIIHQTATTGGSISILQNTSVPGSIAFATAVNVPMTHKPVELGLADINQDNKPDVVVVSDVLMVYENMIQGQLLTVTTQPVNAAICANATGTLTTAATGTTNITYHWQKSAISPISFVDITDGNGLSGAATSSLSIDATVATTPDQFVYRCKISGDNTVPLYTTTVSVTIKVVASPPTVSDVTVCEGATATFTATGADNGLFRWYGSATGGTAIAGAVNAMFTTPAVGSPTTYYVSISNGTCETARVPALANTKSCNGQPNGNPPVIETATGSTDVGGIATVELGNLISDPDNNLDPSTLKVLVQPASGAVASINSDGNLVVNYNGLPFSGADPVTIQECDKTGNCTSQTILIDVGGQLIVFHGISPDGDNKNDKWIIFDIEALPDTKNNHVSLYDRWGDKVFDIDNYDNTTNVFTGNNSSGSALPTGTYFYKISFSNSTRKELTGYLSVKR